MLTPKGWLIAAVVFLLLAETCGLIVQGGQLNRSRAEATTLKADLKTVRASLADTLKACARAETTNAVQAQEAAIICQGEGAELFAAGRRVGRAEGAAQCTAR